MYAMKRATTIHGNANSGDGFSVFNKTGILSAT